MHKHHSIFIYHEIVGLFIVAVVFIHWIWDFLGKSYNLRHLFPWNKKGINAIARDTKGLFQGKLPQGGPREGLPGFIHGLGFLAVTGMAITGLIIFISFQMGIRPEQTKHLHSFIANFVWIYWFGHVALAIAHQLLPKLQKNT